MKGCYGDPKILIEHLQPELLNLQPAQNSLQKLTIFSSSMERICRQLTEIGHPDNSSFLLTTIKNKLPSEVLLYIFKREQLSNHI